MFDSTVMRKARETDGVLLFVSHAAEVKSQTKAYIGAAMGGPPPTLKTSDTYIYIQI